LVYPADPGGDKVAKVKHIYVIDTCVVLHDPMALYKFGEHDIYLPLAVIDDLDDIKTRPGNISWSAREVFRILDKIDLKTMVDKGVIINEEKGKLFIYNTEAPLTKNESPNIVKVNSDNAIINAAISLKNKFPNRPVTIITKDTGLRVRANAWGCHAENYQVDLIDLKPFTGMTYFEVTSDSDWTLLWQNEQIEIAKLSKELKEKLAIINPNEFAIFEYGEFKCPAYHKDGILKVLKEKHITGKQAYSEIKGKNLEQKCALELLNDNTVPLVTLIGAAGTGKSFLAIASALQAINDRMYDKIVVMKPLIPVGGKDIGALPGDKFEKISAWLGPVKDNIDQILGSKSMTADNMFEEMVREGMIEVEAMAFIQGRSIANSIIILDEAQNITPREARMVVERCGKNSKVILLGDPSQVENSYLDARSNGLAHAVSGGKTLKECGTVTLTKVERSVLASVASIIFNAPEARR
jgi:PhoH-like ATPase